MLRKLAVFALCTISICSSQTAARPHDGASPNFDQQIVGSVITRNGAYEFLETLSDRIGPRVTGSSESTAAAELLVRVLKDAGLENVHTESVLLERGWRRGPITAQVISPVQRPILVGTYGWTPGTNGPVEAPIVELTMASNGRFSVPDSTLRGAAVVVNIESPSAIANGYIALRADAIHHCAAAGAAAMLLASDKPHRMVYTSAFGIYPGAPIPVLSIASEDMLYVRRLMAKETVRVRFEIGNQFIQHPPAERNVVAEIRGSTSDIVLVGAHFDSWDPAQGANDNGSGVAAVIETARTLRLLNSKPRATLRFVLFTGEEEGCLGSRAYAETHRSELANHKAFWFMDGGAQVPIGIGLKGRRDLAEAVKPLASRLRGIGADRIVIDGEVGSDDETFLAYGIPSLEMMTETGESEINHHAITDTFDKINPQHLALDTAGFALVAWALATDPIALPRLTPAQTLEHLQRTNLLDEVRLFRGASWMPY